MGSSTSMQGEEPDLELIAKYKETEDNHYVAELFQRHTALILGASFKYLKNSEEAQDAMMEIFEELLRKLLKHDITNFKSWLYSLTRNHCLMKIRKNKGIIEVNLEEEKFENKFMESPSFEHLDKEAPSETDLLQEAMTQLKEHQRTCVEMFFLKEMSYKQVADATGFDMNKVKSYIQNGKRNLYLILSKTQKA